MRLSRCAVLWLEPREIAHFDLQGLLDGRSGVTSDMRWFAHAPQLGAPVEVELEEAMLLGSVSPSDWIDSAPLRSCHGARVVRRLLQTGLLVGVGKAWKRQREADEVYREQHWNGLAAIHHMAGRWQGLDSVKEEAEEEVDTSERLRDRFGPPPPAFHERKDRLRTIALEHSESGSFDELLDRRSTCRNFDVSTALSRDALSQLLKRVFGARGRVHAADDFDVMKRTSPSGGALHP